MSQFTHCFICGVEFKQDDRYWAELPIDPTTGEGLQRVLNTLSDSPSIDEDRQWANESIDIWR